MLISESLKKEKKRLIQDCHFYASYDFTMQISKPNGYVSSNRQEERMSATIIIRN